MSSGPMSVRLSVPRRRLECMDIDRFYSFNTTLFSGLGRVRAHLGDFRGRMETEVRTWDEDALLKGPEPDIVAYLVDKYSIECPVLELEERHLLPSRDVILPGGPQFAGRPFGDVKVKRFVLLVPFTGTADVFRLTPNTIDAKPPRAHIEQGFLSLFVDGGRDPVAIRADFDRQIEVVERHLGRLRGDINMYKMQLEQVVGSAITKRRRGILALRDQESSIGFPVARAAESATFTFPVARKQIVRPSPRSDSPFVPEPAFADEDYEAALHIIGNARNGFERSPSTTAKLDEEEIRDLLLVMLNGHFQGVAGGELFNGQGKTDILIRVQDRNIFVGECKFRGGQSMIGATLDQLLSYMVWRDTKGALLLFIKNKNGTAAIERAVDAIKEHGQFKQALSSVNGERYDFMFSSTSDPERLIKLALIPFQIGC